MMDPAIVRSVLTYALEHGAEFAELFVEDKEELSIKYKVELEAYYKKEEEVKNEGASNIRCSWSKNKFRKN